MSKCITRRFFMEIYVLLEALVGLVAGILLAAFVKREKGVTYGKWDYVGIITNVLLTLAYVCTAPFYLFIGLLCYPAYGGFLGFLGGIVSVVCASVGLCAFLGVGASVALRKRGKRKLSFAVQFAGVAAFALMLLLFVCCYGNLLGTLN